jgi:hypothetical protein
MRRRWTAGLAMVVGVLACGGVAHAQAIGGQKEIITSVHGRVLNAVTKQPVSRALVILHAPSMATFTDDRGQFELKIPENVPNGTIVGATFVQKAIEVRKPGFLQGRGRPFVSYTLGANEQKEVTIYLAPEALIVGHVEVPGSEGDVRITCQLYQLVRNGGKEAWSAQRTFRTWADGEFRFSELEAGTYKLITLEQMDRDSMAPQGAQLFAYTPLYYPNVADFSLANPIVVKAGETARVSLTVTRREYYPVRISVANAPPGLPMNLMVYPVGHRSPGWALGYNAGDGTIRGSLPDGNYTLEASAEGKDGMTGVLDFSVKGAPVEGPTLILVPDATVSVNVREEFQSSQSNFRTPSATQENPRPNRISNVHVTLTGIDEFRPFQRSASSQIVELVEGSEEAELTIPNVKPGQYVVEVQSGIGYVASVQCGGKGVMHQPLVVGSGGSVPPIEIVLRDDGARIEGSLQEEGSGGDAEEVRIVYLAPAGETGGQLRQMGTWQRNFAMDQLPPGDYVLVAFPAPQENLAYGSEDAINQLLSQGGKMVHLEAGQTLSVKIPVVTGDEE